MWCSWTAELLWAKITLVRLLVLDYVAKKLAVYVFRFLLKYKGRQTNSGQRMSECASAWVGEWVSDRMGGCVSAWRRGGGVSERESERVREGESEWVSEGGRGKEGGREIGGGGNEGGSAWACEYVDEKSRCPSSPAVRWSLPSTDGVAFSSWTHLPCDPNALWRQRSYIYQGRRLTWNC